MSENGHRTPKNLFVHLLNSNEKSKRKETRTDGCQIIDYHSSSFFCGGGVILIRNDGNEFIIISFFLTCLLSNSPPPKKEKHFFDLKRRKSKRTKGFCFVIVCAPSIRSRETFFFGNQMDRCVSVCVYCDFETWGRLTTGVHFVFFFLFKFFIYFFWLLFPF